MTQVTKKKLVTSKLSEIKCQSLLLSSTLAFTLLNILFVNCIGITTLTFVFKEKN